jgi:aspartyl-tRNA(Asn)/glutamyl-tRNA(Gln) amidotransferase subunit A
MTGIEIAKKIKNGEISVEEVALEALRKAEGDSCNAFITICEREQVIDRAREVQAQIDSGELKGSALAGVPIAVKDNICTKGIRTTCGSKMLENYIPSYSATVVEKLDEAGLVIIGKTNMDEFGMGSTTETSFFGPVLNPNDSTRVAGGSSGGSAAAVAAGIVPIAMGSDTGGSIRQPAAHCGVMGLKPTYGTVSRYGLVAYASSMDQIGPIATDEDDLIALYDIIKGPDKKDSTSVSIEDGNKEIKELKIGRFEDLDFKLLDYAVPAYYIIACSEASSNLARFDGVKYGFRASEYDNLRDMYDKTFDEGFGEEVKRRIRLGEFTLSHGFYDQYYLKACKVRRLIHDEFKKAFEKYDVILMPTTTGIAPKLRELSSDPISMYKSDLYTVPINLVGLPALSVPCDNKDGLPIGVQLVGDHFSEKMLLCSAEAIR